MAPSRDNAESVQVKEENRKLKSNMQGTKGQISQLQSKVRYDTKHLLSKS